MASPSEIYAAIESVSKSGELPPQWAGVACHSAFIYAAEDLLHRLEQDFTEDDLLKAAALVHEADGSLGLNPVLHPEAGLIIAVRPSHGADPTELLATGCTMGRCAVGLTALLDYRLKEMTECSDDKIFVVGSVEELAILWSCGLPATIVTGLDTLYGHNIDLLIKRLRQIAAPGADEECPITASLVLADWSIAAVDGGDQPWVKKLSKFLTDIDDCEQTKIYGGIWQPDQEALRKIRFCLNVGRVSALQHQLLQSSSGTGWEQDSECSPSYPDAVQRLLGCVGAGEGPDQYKEAYKDCLQSLEKEVIGPLLQSHTDDPFESGLTATLAGLTRQFHMESTSLASKSYRGSQPGRPVAQAETSRDADKSLCMLADRILSITQELQGCKKKHPPRKK